MTDKKHYRDVFKSDHLACADLEALMQKNIPLVFIVEKVTQEMNVKVAGKSGNFNIAHFKIGKVKLKPLVLNAGNSKIMKTLAGGSCFVEDWVNIPVQLYIQSGVRSPSGGELTSGIRINKNPPKIEKTVITKENVKLWNRAKEVWLKEKNFDRVLEKAVLSPQNQKIMLDEIEKATQETSNPSEELKNE